MNGSTGCRLFWLMTRSAGLSPRYFSALALYTNTKVSGDYVYMNLVFRSGTSVALVVILSAGCLAGCGSPKSRQRVAMLSLPYKEFDQSYGSGFRVLYDRGEYLQGALLIEDYLRTHQELTIGQQKFLQLHAAQLFALAGKTARAVKYLDLAVSHEQTSELGPNWNESLARTRAFLTNDRAALLAIKERQADPKAAESVDRIIEKLGGSYEEMLLWHRLCPNIVIPRDASAAHRAAAEKLAKTFGFPLNTVETNSPIGCICIDLHTFIPNPFSGYIIIHTRDGTLITASNPQWLDDALVRFIKSSREHNGHREAPFGLTTSFDVTR